MPNLTPSFQRTRAVLALTAITAPLEIFIDAAAPGSAFEKQLRKVSRWRDECAKLTRGTRLASGAQRDLDSVCARLAPYIKTEHMDHDARLRQWAAIMWVGILYVLGVKCTCSEYGKSQAWVYLDMTAWTLGQMLMQMVPGCDEDGTAIYMLLNGYDWHKQEALMKDAA